MECEMNIATKLRNASIADKPICSLCSYLSEGPCYHDGSNCECDGNVLYALADAIDREYIERPRFEDGEPVQFGDKFVSPFDSDNHETVAEIAVNSEGRYLLRIGDKCGWYAYEPGERVKRPKPQVIGADGKPVKVGETVYAVGYDRFEGPCEVTELKVGGFATVRWNDNSSGAVMASRLTHEQPDSLERIQQDAVKASLDYWGCKSHISCNECPALIDNKKPRDHYGVSNYSRAMTCDLLRRQRKVLERDAR